MLLSFTQARFWWLALLLAGSLFILVRLLYGRTGISARFRTLLRVLRIAALAVLLLMLLQPTASCSFARQVKPELAVLFDSSLSMNASTRTGSTRLTESIKAFEALQQEDPAGRFKFRLFAFGDRLRAVSAPSALAASDNASDFSGAIASFSRAYTGPETRGVILFTDGRFDLDAASSEAIRRLTARNVPVIPVPIVRNESAAADTGLRWSADAPDEILTGRKSVLPVEISRSPAGLAPVTVVFSVDGKPVARKSVNVSQGRESFDFEYTPVTEGLKEFSVIIESAGRTADSFEENNRASLLCKVIKGRYSVLLLGGEPSWEYAFLKRQLENDASLETLSVVKKSGSFPVLAPDAVERADLVVLCGVSPTDVPRSFWTRLKDRVSAGRTVLLLTAGTAASVFSEKPPYAELAALLPFDPSGDPPLTGSFAIELAPEAANDPIALFEDQPGRNDRAWNGLPPFSVVQRIRPKSGSRILGLAKSLPVMGFGPGGRRVFFIAAGPTWKWAFANLPINDDHERYRSFYRRLCRELTSSLSPSGRLSTDRMTYAPDETVRIAARPLSSPGKVLSVVWTGPERTSGNIELRRDEASRERFEGSFVPERKGDYRLSLSDGAETRFRVGGDGGELFDLRPDPSNLERIAALSGKGTGTAADAIKRLDSSTMVRDFTLKRDLWDSAWVILLLTALLASEWILRKTKGLP
jgi:hypothetical protein